MVVTVGHRPVSAAASCQRLQSPSTVGGGAAARLPSRSRGVRRLFPHRICVPQLPAYGQHGRAHGDQPLCQALLIEVVAAGVADSRDTNFVRREGTLYHAGAPPLLTQGSNASRLAGVALTANAMLAVLNDTRSAALIAGAALGVESVGGWGYLLTTSYVDAPGRGRRRERGRRRVEIFPARRGRGGGRWPSPSTASTSPPLPASILFLFGFLGSSNEKVGALWGAAAARMCPPNAHFQGPARAAAAAARAQTHGRRGPPVNVYGPSCGFRDCIITN